MLVASDGNHKDDYSSFGWVTGTIHEINETAKVTREATQCSPTELKDTAAFPF
jgi:hypothetical protein